MKKPEQLKINGIDGAWTDLSRWLVKGASDKDARWFYKNATEQTWEGAVKTRLPFVQAVTDYSNECVAQRKSSATIYGCVSSISKFMQWVDSVGFDLTHESASIEAAFLKHDEHIYRQAWVTKEIRQSFAYGHMQRLALCLSSILNRAPYDGLKHSSRVSKAYKWPRMTSVSRSAEKQNLGDAQALGYFCVDLSNALTIKAIYGKLPIIMDTVRPDGTEQAVQIMPPRYQLAIDGNDKHYTPEIARKLCEPTDTLNQYRGWLLRLRVLAELVIFVYQTGINVTSALRIERQGLKFKSAGSSEWYVTSRKGRKHGAVSFPIYDDYRPRLKEFIKFIDFFFPDDPYLFPIASENSRSLGRIHYDCIRECCARAGIPWMPPQMTRKTRVNFLDRIVGDPDVSAEMAQHTRETFKQNYEKPSQQRAMSALTHFWKKEPVSLINGGCNGKPEATGDKPADVTNPDCIHESGCLWCSKHRDIESKDYVWSLESFRRLKLIEAAQPIKREIPADQVIERISGKLEAFKERNETSRRWVSEAQMRIEEGDYHPTWKNIIAFWEAK